MNISMPTQKAVARTETLYARVQPANKRFLAQQAKAHGFSDTASFTDALLTDIRTNAKFAGSKAATKKTATKRKTAKKAAKK
jgi:hypothetical protein